MMHRNIQRTSWLLLGSAALTLGLGCACAQTAEQEVQAVTARAEELSAQLELAFSSHDVRAIALSGRAVREFEPNSAGASEQPAWRVEKLKLWLSAVVQAHNSLDEDFSASDTPNLNVTPMFKSGTTSISGMDPDEIQDEDVKKDYRARLEENARKAESHTFQMTLRKLDADWTHELSSHVSSQYTKAPEDMEEIRKCIDQQSTDNGEKDKLRSLLIAPAVVIQSATTTAALIQE